MTIIVVHTDITEVSKSLSVLGGFIVLYGLVSFVFKERLYISEPLLAVTLGILVGPYALDWVNPFEWGNIDDVNELTYQLTRIVIGIQVLFCGISLPKAYLWKEKLSLLVLLFGIMTAAWMTTGLLIWALIPDLTFLESLCIAAAVIPTDPVLANSITAGRYAEKYVPANVRNIIVAESGANDGLGFPFLYLAIYLLSRTSQDRQYSVGAEIGRWLYAVIGYQILLSIAYGALVGYLARKTLRWAESRSYIDKANFFAYGLGLAFFTLGTSGMVGTDDILACFIAGNSFTWDDWFRLRTEDNDFQEIIDTILNMAVFVYIGTIIPWSAYNDSSLGLTAWRVVVLVILVLLFRRPPWVIASTQLIPALRNWKESIFAGWFGPIGVGAVFYIQVALRAIPDDGSRDRLRQLYNPVVLLCVFGSILTHGITIPISKLGPGVMRTTATLTKTRSITFSSRVNTLNNGQVVRGLDSAATSPGDSPSIGGDGSGSGSGDDAVASYSRGHLGFSKDGKELWNPLIAASSAITHVFLFWRKDSFWRKEVVPKSKLDLDHHAHHRHSPPPPVSSSYNRNNGHKRGVLKKAHISAPQNAVRQRGMEDDQPGFNDAVATPSAAVATVGCSSSSSSPSLGGDVVDTKDPTVLSSEESSESLVEKRKRICIPPPSLQLPTTNPNVLGILQPVATTTTSLPTVPPPIATLPIPDSSTIQPPHHQQKQSGLSFGASLRRAISNELSAERNEATSEAIYGWQREREKECKRKLQIRENASLQRTLRFQDDQGDEK